MSAEDTKPGDATPAPEISMRPLDWYRHRGTKWPIACLAAAMQGWDPKCDDDCVTTLAQYDAAIAAAEAKVAECREIAGNLPDSSSGRRVFVLKHLSDMHAVVAVRPSVVEATAILNQLNDFENPKELRTQQLAEAMWQRVLWPPAPNPAQPGSGAERQRVMDEQPLAYGNGYPQAFLKAIGLSGDDVRKKSTGF